MTTPLEYAWRWSQLLVAISMVIVEWILRRTITLVFRIIPVPWRNDSSGEDPKLVEDPYCEYGTIEYIIAKGYTAEEHFATTPDGYVLGLHRIPADTTKSDGADELNTHPSNSNPILIIHGFMHSSEAFIRQQASDSLPLVLNDAGKPTHDDFWDFSLDDMAKFDLPTMIDYILQQTGATSVTLIGFSQGTAQSFAYLSKQSPLFSKVNLFIALAPVVIPRGFANPVVDSLARARPDFIFLLFGRRQLLPSTLFWRNNLPRANFVKIIDLALSFLFGWDTSCLSETEKPLLYSHIYAHASVKTVVQWFQTIQSSKFQMFDDYKSVNSSTNSGTDAYPGYVLPKYFLQQIKTPVACFCGGRDTLPHTADIINAIPVASRVLVHIEEKYEHLDFMWAKDVASIVYPKILMLLGKYNSQEQDSCEL